MIKWRDLGKIIDLIEQLLILYGHLKQLNEQQSKFANTRWIGKLNVSEFKIHRHLMKRSIKNRKLILKISVG